MSTKQYIIKIETDDTTLSIDIYDLEIVCSMIIGIEHLHLVEFFTLIKSQFDTMYGINPHLINQD